MNSKEALERLLEMAIDEGLWKSSLVEDLENTIKQDLDRLEKLEKENKYLKTENVMFKTSCELIKKEEDKLIKAIEFLVKGFHFEVAELTTINGESEYYLYWQDKFSSYGVPISKEKYELLKEVFVNVY